MTSQSPDSVQSSALPQDPRWPRAAGVLDREVRSTIALLGVPAHLTSLSPTRADTTPAAVRAALQRYSTYCVTHDREIDLHSVFDAGDVIDPDFTDGEARVAGAVKKICEASAKTLIALGGDNSVTYSVATSWWEADMHSAGLITLDAHHDLRDGVSNGSPVRRLIEAGLSGARVVQIGIADFSNSREYAQRARDYGITVIPRSALRKRSVDSVVHEAIGIAAAAGGPVHVDIDVDVCDRAVVPGTPAAAPGGISADELREFCNLLGKESAVTSIDFTEVDALADSPDGRTVRLTALGVLEFLCGRAAD